MTYSNLSMLLFAGFLYFLVTAGTRSAAKSFKKVAWSNGSTVCAVDQPSTAFNVDLAPINSACVPPNVQCAWRCSREPNCTGYNYLVDAQLCQLYFYPSTGFACDDPSCLYFLVTVLISVKKYFT